MIFVRDIERSENGQANRIHRGSLLGDSAHLAIHIFSELQDVLGIGTAQVIGLIENVDPYAAVGGIAYRLLFGGRGHNGIHSCVLMMETNQSCLVLSWRPAHLQPTQSVAVFYVR